MKNSLIFASHLLFCGNVVAEVVKPLIIGGTDVTDNSRSYQVALLSRVSGTTSSYNVPCGGALIADRWVLTAAHCLNAAKITSVALGSNNLADNSATVIEVNKWIPHPNYDPLAHNNDVALLRLASPAPAHLERLRLADVTFMADFVRAGDLVKISGWGGISPELPAKTNTSSLNSLKTASVPVVAWDVCSANAPSTVQNVMCTGRPKSLAGGIVTEQNVGVCPGDSGGPVTKQVGGYDYSVGVISYLRTVDGKCAEAGTVDVHARTAYHLDWIKAQMSAPQLMCTWSYSWSGNRSGGGGLWGPVALGQRCTSARIGSTLRSSSSGITYNYRCISTNFPADIDVKSVAPAFASCN